jgi:hypothetical protein
MRRNPLDIAGQPKGLVVLGVAGAAAILGLTGGLALNARTAALRAENVRAALTEAGYGRASVRPIAGDECWRGREGFTWETATARGSACAGPRDEVHLFPGQPRPSLSGVAKLKAGAPR